MTVLRTPDPDLDRAFALAIRRAEGLLAGAAAGPLGAAEIGAAVALLGAGVRAPARAMLRALADSPAPAGAESAERGRLIAGYRAWVGDLDASVEPDAPMAERARGVAAAREVVTRFLRDPEPADATAVTGVLEAVISGLWGLAPHAPTRALLVRPRLPQAWPSMALERLRVGQSVMDLAVRRRRGDLVVGVRRVGGPAMDVTVEPDPVTPGPAVVDDVELAGGRARLEAVERHEIIFRGALS